MALLASAAQWPNYSQLGIEILFSPASFTVFSSWGLSSARLHCQKLNSLFSFVAASALVFVFISMLLYFPDAPCWKIRDVSTGVLFFVSPLLSPSWAFPFFDFFREFISNLRGFSTFYSGLGEALCSREPPPANHSLCWNGQEMTDW